jgi:glutathione peroxidase
MAELSARFGEKLAILAFPSDEFGGQELPTDAEVARFAYERANFPEPPAGYLLAKGRVNGDDARAAWKLLKEASGAPDPTWNFKGKFLVSPDGAVTVPGRDLAADIEALL